MFNKIKKIISEIDRFLFKKFGTEKNIKFLENLKEAKIIFSYLNEIGKEDEVKFVGGCVRKALCGENIDDIDLATSLRPDVVKQRLNKSGVKVIDIGGSYGTITAILNQVKFEITTLRKDVATDGRHANVEFTSNWEQDAHRRDFTINAIYADINGKIFDPLNGMSDLNEGIVKFIGNPTERIQEDYLRILRYIRFFLQYSKIEHEGNTVRSIKSNINGLNKISKERIFIELQKILKLKNILNLFYNSISKELLLTIFPQIKFYERLEKVQFLNSNIREKIDELFILALLIIDKSDNYEYFCHKYKTSNKTRDRFFNLAKNLNVVENKNFLDKENIKKYLYYENKNSVNDLLLFAYFINEKIKTLDLEESINYLGRCKKPIFPISGNFLKEYGFESGENLGKILKKLENAWILNNFHLDEEKIKMLLKK